LIFLLIGWILLVLRITLLRFFPEGLLSIEPTTIIVIYLGFTRTLIPGGILSLLLGYMTDFFSGGFTGLYTFILTSLFFLTRIIKKRFYTKELFFQMGMVFLLSLAGGIVMLFILLTDHFSWEFYPRYMSYIMRAAFFNSIFSSIIFLLFRKIDAL